MKFVFVIFFSLIIAVLLPTFMGCMAVDEMVVSTLFTIVGIIFSVIMSLVISVSTSNVKNKEAKEVYRKQLSRIRCRFVAIFTILTILYIIIPLDNETEILHIARLGGIPVKFSCNIFMTACLSNSIIYYIVNYSSIQTSVYEIEDRIDEEEQ